VEDDNMDYNFALINYKVALDQHPDKAEAVKEEFRKAVREIRDQ